MRIAFVALSVVLLPCLAFAEVPDLSKLPPHPRLWIGGLKDASGYIDPAALAERAKARPDVLKLLSETSDISARALVASITGDKAILDKVVADLKAFKETRGDQTAQCALAFDWTAPLMSEADRKQIARVFLEKLPNVRRDVATRFNPFDNNPLQREMAIGLAALAIIDDEPSAIELLKHAHALYEDFIKITGDGAAPDDMAGRGCYGGGWPEGYDYDRHGSRYAMMYFLGLRSATGMEVFSNSPFWKAKQYYHIYATLPNGYNVLPFQDMDYPFMLRHDREVMLVLAREFKDPHAQWYVRRVNTELDSSGAVFEFLYGDPKLPEHDYSDLPKARYFPGVGTVIARSGWGLNDTYVAFTASDWYVYHQNNAQNVFAIYRNAPLAVKDGVYDGSVHDHYVNYSIRTVAYNGVTVLDPSEKFRGPDGIPEAANDGGQMIQQWKSNPDGFAMWREQARRQTPPMRDIVDWKGFETNDVYTYAAAEAGRAYAPGKVPFFSRQILFIYPNWIVVFDRVTAGEASFVKKFHLHAPDQLTVSGSNAVATTGKWYVEPDKLNEHLTVPGRLFIASLLPASAKVERTEGKAAYEGISHVGSAPYSGQFLCPSHLEITAPQEKTTYFLTAMYACDAAVEKAPEAKVIEETPDKVTVSLEDGKFKFSFAKTGEVSWNMIK